MTDEELEVLAKVATSAELGPLRELAQEGAAMHSPGMPERTLCDGLLAALDEVERLRAAYHRSEAHAMRLMVERDAWQRRFPQYVFRQQDDCVALRA